MSDAPTPPIDSPPPAPPAPATPSSRPGKARRWRRRLTVALIALLVLGVIGRFVISLALPVVMNRVMAFYNLSCTYDRAELSVSDGNLNLFNLTLRPKEGGEPIAHADFIYGNIVPIELIHGRLHVLRMEADGIDLNVDRNADGTIPLLQRLVHPTAAAANSSTPTTPRPLVLDAPLKVEAFRLSHLSVHIRDQHVSPTLDTTVQLAVRVTDLGVPGKATSFEVGVAADQLLEGLRLNGQATTDGKNLAAQMTVAVRNLHPKPAAGYLIPAGISPAADSISMQMSAALSATVAPNLPNALTGNLTLSNLSAEADGEQSIRVDKVNVGIDTLDATALHLAQVLVDGVHISTSRTHEGLLQACGIQLTTPEKQAAPPTTQPAYGISVASVQLHNCRLDLTDQAVTPAAALAVQLDALTIAAPTTGGPLAITGQMSVPGVASQIDLSGSAAPFAAVKTADLIVRVKGLQPTALKPYLDAVGLQSEFTNGSFACDLTGSLSPLPDGSYSADAHLTNLHLDNGKELLGLNDVQLKGVSADAQRIRFDSIDVTGPTLVVQRDAGGEVSLLGLRTKPRPAPQTSSQTPTTAPTTSVAAGPAPRLEIGKFLWHGMHLHLEDQTVSPAQIIAINDVGMELHDLSVGLDPSDYAANTGKIKAWIVAPGFVDRLDFAGNVTPGPSALQLDLTANGTGVSPAALSPYLQPLGIEPLTRGASVSLHAQLAVAKHGDALDTSVQLDGFHYTSAGHDLLAVDALRIDHAQIGGKTLPIDAVVIDHPQANIQRDADGSLIFSGIKLLQSKSAPTTARASQPSVSNAPAASPSTPFISTLASLQIHHADLSWTDRAVKPQVTTSLTSDIDLKNLTIGQPARPADVHITAAVPNVIRQITVTGQVSPAPGAASAHLDVNAGGIVIGPLSAYLPPGITSTLTDGQLKLTLDAGLATNPKGGQTAKLSVNGLDYRDGASKDPLFKMDDLRVVAPRIDPAGSVIAVDEISTHGIELSATKSTGGTMRLLGLSIASPPPTTQPAATQPAAPPPQTESGLTAAQMIAAEQKPLPLITLDKLDLNVHRVSLIDATRPKAAPLSLVDLRLQNKNRIEWLGPKPATRPPTLLQLTTGVAPLADRFSLAIKFTPFALQPAVTLDLSASGIHGDGLTALVPELADKLDGSAMTNGQAAAHFEALLKLSRRSPTDFDLSRPFALDFSLTNVQFHSSPDSPLLAGLDEVRADGIRVVPAESNVEVKSLEITKPALLVVREKDGIHALGWTIKLPEPTTQPATAPTSRPVHLAETKPATTQAVHVAQVKSAPNAPATQPAPAGEIKIDRIIASGLDVRIEDRTTNPVTVVPLTGLDLEIRDLSSQAPYQDKPVRFSVLVNSGKVPLPAKSGKGTEERDLLSQISASGKVGLYPELNGWAKASVSGFELAGVTGEAATENIALTGGTFDADVDLRFQPGNVINVTAKPSVTDMTLADSPDGRLRSLFGLPASLDTCIGIVQAADGSITLPLNFQIKGSSPEGIGGAVVGAVGSVVATAVASAPVKVVGGLASALGMGTKKPGEEQRITLSYSPGAVGLEPDEQSTLQTLAQRMIKEPNIELTVGHNFGTADVAALAGRANPSPADARSLAYQLRAHKLELSSLRAQVAGQAEAQLAAFDETEANQTVDRLRAIDRELAQTEDALDRTYDLLQPGAQRQADRRTRAAGLEVAAQRLAAVREFLGAQGVPDVDRRVHLLHPTFAPSDSDKDSTVIIQPVRTRNS